MTTFRITSPFFSMRLAMASSVGRVTSAYAFSTVTTGLPSSRHWMRGPRNSTVTSYQASGLDAAGTGSAEPRDDLLVAALHRGERVARTQAEREERTDNRGCE